MKYISLSLNVVLIVAVAVLYFLHFKENKSGESNAPEQPVRYIPLASSGIVFVNSDSLLEHYEFYKNAKSQFEESQRRIKNELKTQGENLQKEIEQYQQQAIGMTDAEKARKEEQLQMKQQQIMQRKEELLDRLDSEQSKSSEELYSRLNQFLKQYNKGKNYSYVLGFQKGGGILYANDSLNITRDVVDGLNKEFSSAGKK